MKESMQQGVSCVVCGKQRAPGQIHKGQSKLMPRVDNFLICNVCAEAGKEPRGFIIIIARTGENGLAKVKPYIEHHRYEGPEITGRELL
jgi:hypothetical protein